MVSIRESIVYPWKSDSLPKHIVFGVLFILFSPLVIPAFCFAGYYARMLKCASMGENPPGFNNWVDMLFEGVYTVFIILAYTVVPISVFALVFSVTPLPPASLLVSIIFFYVYVSPVPVILYMRRGSVVAAFDISTITDVIFTRDYFIAVIISIVLSIVMLLVLGSIAFVLLQLPDALTFVLFPLFFCYAFFWLYIVWAALCGKASNPVLGDRRFQVGK